MNLCGHCSAGDFGPTDVEALFDAQCRAMTPRPDDRSALVRRVQAIDARLLAVSKPVQCLVLALTVTAMIGQSLRYVPREYVDYSHLAMLSRIAQPGMYGSDTVGDSYEAKVVLNDVFDMYTKTGLEQTPVEAVTWSKAASAPYPPTVLLAEAALYRLGEWTGLRFYGLILILACVFLGLSLWYFLATRWYLFPLLYLNFSYLSYRFVSVQDCSYLVMLVVVVAALWLARARRPMAHALMAIAISMKLIPLYYAKNVFVMPRRTAVTFVSILTAGLVLPYFIWDNYLYIFAFHETVKGDWRGLVAAVCYGIPFAAALWYVEAKLGFDLEDRVGWGMVPVAMIMAMKMNVPRHLLLALLVPDKRGLRNLAVALALGLQALLPELIRFGSVLSILTGLVFLILLYYLGTIGWRTVWDDWKNPGRTLRMMLSAEGGQARALAR